jgi:flagellar basal body L-ring protein FlgH
VAAPTATTSAAAPAAADQGSKLPGRSGLDTLGEKDLKSSAAEKTKESMQKALVWSQLDLSEAINLKAGESVMAEIVDRYPNGNYKIRATRQISYRGQKRLMKVLGIVRGSDVEGNETVPTGKLYEYSINVYP